MDGSQVVSEALSDMISGAFALFAGLLMVIGLLYLGKAMWVIFRRRK
jgi:hypothetical protein